jgi:glycerol-3-phosphate O-acyltransferase
MTFKYFQVQTGNNLGIRAPFRDIIKPFQKEAPESKYWKIMEGFLDDFETIITSKGLDKEFYQTQLTDYATQVLKQIISPYNFEPYHKAIREPFDHFDLGSTLFRPLIDFIHSKLFGKENLQEIESILAKGENVVIFANHQTEADPQAINLLLENEFETLPHKIAYVAGERVVTDALAVPFSLGINLFCVYSKKYFDVYPERRTQMLEHNKRTMLRLGDHLDTGSKCIMIFPSGGRDRPDENKIVRVSKFDQQSIELMYLLGRKAKASTHYFPLALSTHDMLPPPEDLQIDLGEKRPTNEASVYLHFGKEIDMENFPNSDTSDKAEKKNYRAQYIYDLVSKMYESFPG